MKKSDIKKTYSEIKIIWESRLKKHGIKMPKLFKNKSGEYSIKALCLIYLYFNKKIDVSKEQLTSFIRMFYPQINDVQSARHLSTQDGWNIQKSGAIHNSTYRIDTIDKPHISWNKTRRNVSYGIDDWQSLKKSYDFRCATCGSKENEVHLKFKNDITRLEKGHCDPRKELTLDNTIPQCYHCNRVYKNKFIFDKNGFIKQQIN